MVFMMYLACKCKVSGAFSVRLRISRHGMAGARNELVDQWDLKQA